jgi:hypothetical protein
MIGKRGMGLHNEIVNKEADKAKLFWAVQKQKKI